MHARGGVGIFEVVYELRQILNRVDVVMRRRRDELNAGRGVANPADILVNLMPRQLAALAGL